jgi:hypothetical protein
MDLWFAPDIQPLLYLPRPIYYIPVTEISSETGNYELPRNASQADITKTMDGAVLVARQGQKDVARIPLFCVYEVADSRRQLKLECNSATVVFTKMVRPLP